MQETVAVDSCEATFGSERPLSVMYGRGAALWLSGLIAAIVFLPGLGLRGLWTPDEPRVGGIVAEMADSGDFLVPRLNGKPFLEKPPLGFAICALSLRAFGRDSLFALRLPVAICAVATVVLCSLLAWWAFGSGLAAILSACILSTNFEFWQIGGWLVVDTMLALFVLAALSCFYMSLTDARRRIGWEIGMALALAGAVLTKNLVGLAIPFAAMVGCLLLRRDFRWRTWVGLVVCYAAAALAWGGWLWALYHRLGADSVYETAWVNTIGRFTGSRHSHVAPVWDYLEDVPAAFLPWAVFLPGALREFVRRDHFSQSDEGRVSLLLMSIAAPLVLLSLSAGKRTLYALPLFPLLAVVTGGWLAQVLEGRSQIPTRWYRVSFRVCQVLVGIVMVGIPGGLIYLHAGVALIVASCIVGGAAIAFLVRGCRSAASRQSVAVLAAVQIVACVEASTLLMAPFDALKSMLPGIRLAEPYASQGIPVYLCTSSESFTGLMRFYSRRNVPVLAGRDGFNHFMASPRAGVCLTRRRDMRKLGIEPTCVVGRRRIRKKEVLLIASRAFLSTQEGRDRVNSSGAGETSQWRKAL